MAGDAGRLLDCLDTVNRNSTIHPAGYKGLVHTKRVGEIYAADTALRQKRKEVVAHSGHSCATRNQSQQPMLRIALTTWLRTGSIFAA